MTESATNSDRPGPQDGVVTTLLDKLDVTVLIEDDDVPVTTSARVHIEKVDYQAITMSVDGLPKRLGNFDQLEQFGVYLGMSGGTLRLEIFDASEEVLAFMLKDGKWVSS